MKLKKLGLVVGLSLMTMGLVACGNSTGSETANAAKEVSKKSKVVYENQKNVDGVIKALNSVQPKFKANSGDWDGGGGVNIIYASEKVWSHTVTGDKTEEQQAADYLTYGYDDPKTGISEVAFADQNNLNNAQLVAVDYLTSGVDKENKLRSKDIWKNYPDDAVASNGSPYQGADIDYVTVSNLETEPSEKEPNMLMITGKVTYHLHLLDGSEVDHEFTTSATPDSSTEPIDEEDIEDAYGADKMNEELPLNRSGYTPLSWKNE